MITLMQEHKLLVLSWRKLNFLFIYEELNVLEKVLFLTGTIDSYTYLQLMWCSSGWTVYNLQLQAIYMYFC